MSMAIKQESQVIEINQPDAKSIQLALDNELAEGWRFAQLSFAGEGFACHAYIVLVRDVAA